ncbi:MAG: hypothetical protein ABI904_09925 [Chloroflexota bacterium]
MAQPQLTPRFTPSARVEDIPRGFRLSIPSGFADSYRLAQLDNYAQLSRSKFPLRFPLSLSLSARTSSDSIAGTWGFGLWNDPFGLSLGFGGNPFRLPTLPNAVWFFGASQENYLSFKDSRPERSRRLLAAQSKGASSANGATNAPSSAQREIAANGFLAQTFRSPKFHPWLILAGLALPFSRKVARRLLGRVIADDGVQLWNEGARSRNIRQQAVGLQNQSHSVDPTQWHRYRLDWSLKRVSFEVDEVQVFESAVSPHPPLGLVIWIDNQYAAFTPEGRLAFGVLQNEAAWLEVMDIKISPE